MSLESGIPKVDKDSNQHDPHAIDLGPNWRGKDLDKEELDLEAQQTALDLLKQNFLRKKAAKAEYTATAQIRMPAVSGSNYVWSEVHFMPYPSPHTYLLQTPSLPLSPSHLTTTLTTQTLKMSGHCQDSP